MDNELIINKIKKHYNLDNNAQLARKLGINTSTLSGWINKRGIGNWELIFKKCPDIDFNWLIKGAEKQETLRNENVLNEPKLHYANKDGCTDCSHKERLIEQLQKENDRLWNIVGGNNAKNDSTQAG